MSKTERLTLTMILRYMHPDVPMFSLGLKEFMLLYPFLLPSTL